MACLPRTHFPAPQRCLNMTSDRPASATHVFGNCQTTFSLIRSTQTWSPRLMDRNILSVGPSPASRHRSRSPSSHERLERLALAEGKSGQHKRHRLYKAPNYKMWRRANIAGSLIAEGMGHSLAQEPARMPAPAHKSNQLRAFREVLYSRE